MKTFALVLSGCGVKDGSEIHEAVACLYALEAAGINYQCIAPNITQTHVVNHFTGETLNESRNVLVEAARIARGKIKAMDMVSANDFDAAIYPGGFGAALNLCDFGIKGSEHEVQKDTLAFAKAMAQAKKPQGFICIAPVMISKIYGPGVKLTIGNDTKTVQAIAEMGGVHEITGSGEIVIDQSHKVVSTPAYMVEKTIPDVFSGIQQLVRQLIEMT